jgi:hypothetical protein
MKPIPPELEPVRDAARRALGPVTAANSLTHADERFLFTARRTEASGNLPHYYLIYFLLVDLLGFENLGRYEKVAWSIPIDYCGQAFLVEHRKFGVGVFAHEPEKEEEAARDIVMRIQRAVKTAVRFFDWLARQAVETSAVNVVNNSSSLFDRYKYLRDACRAKTEEAEMRKDERVVEEGGTESKAGMWRSVSFPAFRLRMEADWLAMSAIEAFFSWTEHVFIHIAILTGRARTAADVASLAESNWRDKFKAAIDLGEPKAKSLFDKLIAIREELRNYIAHGAFGKQSEAFTFHSGAGAVPVMLPHQAGSKKFTFGHGLGGVIN